MSKIERELSEATEVTAKRGQSRQEFLSALVLGVAKLSDKEWDNLTPAAQDWYNAAAEEQNAAKKAKRDAVLEDFADAEKEEPVTRRRGSASDEKEEAPTKSREPKLKDMVKVVTKRGKSVTGTVVEIDDEVIVLKMGDGSEEEFDRSRLESITVAGGESDEPAADPVKVGSTVKVVTKRGKELEGKIVELDDEVLVLKTADGEEELNRDRIETIKPVAGEESTRSSRRSSDKGAEKEEAKGEPEKTKRSSNAEGVSIGTRIKELICDDLDATEADIAKALKKEGIEFKENTLKLNYVDCHKLITIMKAKKLIK